MVVRISVEQDVLRGNSEWAQKNRNLLQENEVWTLNLMSSPGAGKTSMLEKVIPLIQNQIRMCVIEGDVMTTLDAERIASLGIRAVQINTHGACHLDAKMIHDVIQQLPMADIDLMIIENVGNLVCPADFDLGEDARVAMLSVPEGEDKVAKYPSVFRRSDVVLLNKMDLLPHVKFDMDRFQNEMQLVNADAPIFRISAVTGEGVNAWSNWIIQQATQGRIWSE